jgi:thioredoxin-like negative regulator of GroEL
VDHVKTVGPIIDQLAVENEGIAIGKVNVEENPDLAAEHKVSYTSDYFLQERHRKLIE